MEQKANSMGGMNIASNAAEIDERPEQLWDPAAPGKRDWTTAYLRQAGLADCACALAAGLLAAQIRFGGQGRPPTVYLAFTVALPVLWWASVLLAGGYDSRFIGLGSD